MGVSACIWALMWTLQVQVVLTWYSFCCHFDGGGGGPVVVVFTRSRPVTRSRSRSRSPAYPACLSRLLRCAASSDAALSYTRFFQQATSASRSLIASLACLVMPLGAGSQPTPCPWAL